jgi:hypothetical protein
VWINKLLQDDLRGAILTSNIKAVARYEELISVERIEE